MNPRNRMTSQKVKAPCSPREQPQSFGTDGIDAVGS